MIILKGLKLSCDVILGTQNWDIEYYFAQKKKKKKIENRFIAELAARSEKRKFSAEPFANYSNNINITSLIIIESVGSCLPPFRKYDLGFENFLPDSSRLFLSTI